MTPTSPNLLPLHSALLNWYARKGRKNLPWRRLRNPFSILLAEILLQRTSARVVANNFQKIHARLPTLTHLLAIPEKDLQDLLKPLGLFQRRAKYLKDLAYTLQNRFHGKIPHTYEELASLIGLGDYIPRAVLCFAWGQRVAVVDLNVIRIFSRMFSIQPKSWEDPRRTPEITRIAEDLLPPVKHVKKYNWSLLDLGALVCKPKFPECEVCPIATFCDHYKNLANNSALPRD